MYRKGLYKKPLHMQSLFWGAAQRNPGNGARFKMLLGATSSRILTGIVKGGG